MASKSEFDLDEDMGTEVQKQPWYRRLAFWKAAVPTLFSFLALAAALTLLLVPQFHFKTTVTSAVSHLLCVSQLLQLAGSVSVGWMCSASSATAVNLVNVPSCRCSESNVILPTSRTDRTPHPLQVNVKATDTAAAYSYRSGEIHRFLVRWCFFAAGLTPTYVIAWYIMHVSLHWHIGVFRTAKGLVLLFQYPCWLAGHYCS